MKLIFILVIFVSSLSAEDRIQKSLLIVFDGTGSMGDDLDQVIPATKDIIKTYANHPDAPIKNYILSVFHCPNLDPVIDSTDPQLVIDGLKKTASNLGEVGWSKPGGEVPLMGLIQAIELETALQNSIVFLITDDGASDFDLEDKAISILRKKQITVNFIITGTGSCQELTGTYCKPYENIARASGGLTINTGRQQIKSVIDTLQKSFDPDITGLVKIISEVAGKQEEDVNIDQSVQEICASVSGKNPKLDIYGPQKEKLQLFSELVMDRYRFGCIENPNSGSYRFEIQADSGYSAKIEARSKLKFDFGFSIEPVEFKSETNVLPLQNYQNILSIFPSDASLFQTILKAFIQNGVGSTLKELKVTKVSDEIYSTEKFDLPTEAFTIKIEGLDAVAVPFFRIITPASLVPESGSIPEMFLNSEETFCTNEKFILKCKVKSQIPVTIKWTLNGAVLKEISAKQSKELQLTYDTFDVDKKGTYKCIAKNDKGEASKQVTVEVFKMPKVKLSAPSLELVENSDHQLKCEGAESGSKVKWTDENGNELSQQSTFSFFPSRKFDGKQMTCEVTNGLCKDKDTKTFTIHYVPTFNDGQITQMIHKTVKFGATEKLDCSSDRNVTKHKLRWFLHGFDNVTRSQAEHDEKEIVEWRALKDSDGILECVIDNKIKPARRQFNLSVTAWAAPKIIFSPSNLTFNENTKIDLICRCSECLPVSNSLWTYENSSNIEISTSDNGNNFESILTIKKVDRSQAGKFKCKIENNLGSDEVEMEIVIQTEPKIKNVTLKVGSDVKKVDLEIGIFEGNDAEFLCFSDGFPAPSIYWTLNGTKISDTNLFEFKKASTDHEGFYECVAENVVKSNSKKFDLFLEFAPKLQSEKLQKLQFNHKTQAVIKCEIHGRPTPSIKWRFKGSEIYTRTGSKYETKDGGKVLEFEANEADEGLYSCEGENKFGKVSMDFDVIVKTTPTFIKSQNEHLEIKKDSKLELTCEAIGFPSPTVQFIKDGLVISKPNSITFTQSDVQMSDAGVYLCVAENNVGSSTKSFNVTVVEPPTISSNFANVTLKDDETVEVTCEARGVPTPTLKWKFEGTIMSQNGTLKLSTNDSRGFYECVAQNSAGKDDSKKFYANIRRLNPFKEINEIVKELTVKEHDSFELLCPYRNYDEIKWSLNAGILPKDLANVTENKLKIKNIKRNHDGKFSCLASDPRDKFTFEYKIEVLSAPMIKPFIEVDGKMLDYSLNSDIQEFQLKLGSKMKLSCESGGNPKPAVIWYKSNIKMLEKEVWIENSVDHKSSAVYTCVAQNSQGETKKFFKIDVVAAPQLIESKNKLMEVNVNDETKLECSMKASPLPQFIWFKNNERLEGQTSSVLHLEDIKISDHGTYLCLAFNFFGNSEQKFDVSVLEAPKVIEPTEKEMIIRNSTFTLSCAVNSNPVPQFWWSGAGQTISGTGQISDEVLKELNEKSFVSLSQRGTIIKNLEVLKASNKLSGTSKLTKIDARTFKYETIVDFKPSMQNEPFTCLALNSKGRTSNTIKILKFEKPHKQNEKVEERRKFDKDTLNRFESEKLEIECPFIAIPLPTYTWIKNGIELQGESLEIKDGGRKLIAENSSEVHSGNYSCIAENVEGRRMANIEVIINTRPRFKYDSNNKKKSATRIDQETTEVIVMKGSSAVLKCEVEGTPKPIVYWMQSGFGDFKNATKFYGKGDILIVPNVITRMNFFCHANNTYGITKKKFILKPAHPPIFDKPGTERTITVTEGKKIVLECELKAEPRETIKWTKDSQDFTKSPYYNFASRDRVAEITKSEMRHNGIYTCTASNEHGQISRTFYVKVKPEVEYTPWSAWSPCQGECDSTGSQFRMRRCSFKNPVKGILTCPDDIFQMQECPLPACWSEWGPWEPRQCPDCRPENEKRVQLRARYCTVVDDTKCVGNRTEESNCNIPVCETRPANNWKRWGPWKPFNHKGCPKCYKSGYSIPQEHRVRECKFANKIGCPGDSYEYRKCPNIEVCIIPDRWSKWSEWSACSRTCGWGFKVKTRKCLNSNGKCTASREETDSCKVQDCERFYR